MPSKLSHCTPSWTWRSLQTEFLDAKLPYPCPATVTVLGSISVGIAWYPVRTELSWRQRDVRAWMLGFGVQCTCDDERVAVFGLGCTSILSGSEAPTKNCCEPRRPVTAAARVIGRINARTGPHHQRQHPQFNHFRLSSLFATDFT